MIDRDSFLEGPITSPAVDCEGGVIPLAAGALLDLNQLRQPVHGGLQPIELQGLIINIFLAEVRVDFKHPGTTPSP